MFNLGKVDGTLKYFLKSFLRSVDMLMFLSLMESFWGITIMSKFFTFLNEFWVFFLINLVVDKLGVSLKVLCGMMFVICKVIWMMRVSLYVGISIGDIWPETLAGYLFRRGVQGRIFTVMKSVDSRAHQSCGIRVRWFRVFVKVCCMIGMLGVKNVRPRSDIVEFWFWKVVRMVLWHLTAQGA